VAKMVKKCVKRRENASKCVIFDDFWVDLVWNQGEMVWNVVFGGCCGGEKWTNIAFYEPRVRYSDA